jgi:dihydroflavonol-4-reductase
MRVLVTGATGFVGSHLAEHLHRKQHRVRCFIRKTSDTRWLRHLPIEYVDGDFFDKGSLQKAVEGMDMVYHCAGVVASKTKAGFYEGNQHATRNLLEAITHANPSIQRFVHVSSLTAVGPTLNEDPVDETTPYHPITTYGRSKMEAEKEVLKFTGVIPWTIVRPPTVYGPRDPATFDFFTTAAKGLIPLAGFNRKLVSMVHATDLANGIILAGERKEGLNQIYFIGSERYYDWEEIARITLSVIGRKAITVRVPEFLIYVIAAIAEVLNWYKKKPSVLNWEKGRDMVQRAWICDITKAKTELGYEETISLEDGIRETIAWYRKEGWMR